MDTWFIPLFTPPTCKTVMALHLCWPRSSGASRGCATFSPMAATRAANSETPCSASENGPWRSSSALTSQAVLKYCHGGGLWNAGLDQS